MHGSDAGAPSGTPSSALLLQTSVACSTGLGVQALQRVCAIRTWLVQRHFQADGTQRGEGVPGQGWMGVLAGVPAWGVGGLSGCSAESKGSAPGRMVLIWVAWPPWFCASDFEDPIVEARSRRNSNLPESCAGYSSGPPTCLLQYS